MAQQHLYNPPCRIRKKSDFFIWHLMLAFTTSSSCTQRPMGIRLKVNVISWSIKMALSCNSAWLKCRNQQNSLHTLSNSSGGKLFPQSETRASFIIFNSLLVNSDFLFGFLFSAVPTCLFGISFRRLLHMAGACNFITHAAQIGNSNFATLDAILMMGGQTSRATSQLLTLHMEAGRASQLFDSFELFACVCMWVCVWCYFFFTFAAVQRIRSRIFMGST